jgi:predicted 2-oxoglutarate/Fe(II)-dependent dioxygenase YbiX
MKPTIYADKIFYYEGVIENPKRLVDLLESTDQDLTDADAITKWNEWVASGDGSKYVFGRQKHTDPSKLASSSSDVEFIYTTLAKVLTDYGKDYCTALGIEYMEPSPISISKYQEGAEMGPHVDWYGDPSIEPIMSAVLYLNDDCVGGELEFTEVGVKIKPSAGSIIIFPSVAPYYHQSLKIESGFKYMSPAFWVKHLN